MKAVEFVQFTTTDGLRLPGLFFQANESDSAAIYLHGNGSSSVFYKNDYLLPETLTKQGISTLLFNNRGAHIIKDFSVDKNGEEISKSYGMAYEIIRECVFDIDAAIDFLCLQGYRKFYLIGHSTGANKICVYDFYKPENEIEKYILLGGGDDTGIYFQELGSAFHGLLANARNEIDSNNGDALITELLPLIFSQKAFYDIANPDGDYNVFPFYEALQNVKLSTKPLFRYFSGIKKPTLVIYGESDPFVSGALKDAIAVLKKLQPDFTYRTIPQADHMFSGQKKKLAETIINWL